MQRRDLLAISGAALCSAAGAHSGKRERHLRMRRKSSASMQQPTAARESRTHHLAGCETDRHHAHDRRRLPRVRRDGAGLAYCTAQAVRDQHDGELEVELTDGTRRKIGSDLVFLEDLTGKGHVTRALGPITNVFLHVPVDFDVVAGRGK